MELMRKVTPAFLSAGINLRKIEGEYYLGRIYGVASGHETVPTQYGESEKFDGEFVAERADGKKGMAPSCYLPGTVSPLLVAALENADSVKFGFDISAVPSEKSAVGYTWKIVPLMEVKPTESLLSFANGFPPLAPTKALREPELEDLLEPEAKTQVEHKEDKHGKRK